jgi:hypothetical protein
MGINASSSPASLVQGKKKTHNVVQNGIILAPSFFFSFFLTVDETVPFWIKRCRFGQNDAVLDKTHDFI